jgi:hypothetical protein
MAKQTLSPGDLAMLAIIELLTILPESPGFAFEL